MNLPTGTVTFLFTDIEGSTKLWERSPEAMSLALARHDAVLKATIERHNGYVFKTVGDACCAAFPTALDALNAALEAQLTLLEQEWGETGPIRVRMGLHTGVAQERDNDYFGPTLNRVARLQGIGHGQQTLLSQTTYALISTCPAEATLMDLGLHRLKDLAEPEHVWQLNHPALPLEFPPLRSLSYLSTNLPQQLTSFIGRETEMEAIKERLKQTRLLTLTGSGGCGKTRLAVQVGAEVLEQYADGVWLVELAALSNPSLVPQTVAEALSIRESRGEPITITLISALKDKQMLLMLDNCEHVLDTSAHLVDALLKSCPKVSVLASSREALRITGESDYRVPSLSVPPLIVARKRKVSPESLLHYESVRLFTERAIATRSDFAVTPQNASALASVCHRLDGIPLAIELAAARVKAIPLEQIERRLESRFRLLTVGSRTALPRQQTLKALIDWSYNLLKEQEKTLLNRLSVFAGGWSLEATEAVCGAGEEKGLLTIPLLSDEILDLLTSLVDKSLVVYQERKEKARYHLLETVRQYARDRLLESGESEALRKRHRDYFLAFAEETEPKMHGPEQREWLQQLEAEHENLRVALGWSLSKEPDSGEYLRLCGALQQFWWTHGHLSEGREWSVQALRKSGAQERTKERAKALNGSGILAQMQGDYAAARAYQEESMILYREIGDRRGIAGVFNGLGLVASEQGDYTAARTYLEESLALWREVGDRRRIPGLLNNLGMVAYYQGDFATARTYYQEALIINREIGNRAWEANNLNGLGNVAEVLGDYASARVYLEECLAIQREFGDCGGIATALINLGLVAFEQGDYASTRTQYEESLALWQEIGERYGIAYTLGAFAFLNVKENRLEQAGVLWGATEALREEIGSPLSPIEQEQYDRSVTEVRQELGEEAFSTAWGIGHAMTLEHSIEYALEATG